MSGFGLQTIPLSVEFSSSSGTISIQNSVTRIGPWALRSNPSGGASGFVRYHVFTSTQSTHVYFRAYLRIASLPSAAAAMMRIVDTANLACATVRLSTSGTLQLLNAAGTQVGSSSSALSTNTWYRVELELDASSSPGSISARIDGTSFASGANSSQTPWARVIVGPIANVTTDVYFADLAVNDTSGTLQNSWPGDGAVLTLTPAAAGDANAWRKTDNTTAGDSTSWQLVDELPPNDATDYTQTVTAAAVDSFTIAQHGAPGGVVNCVMVGIRGSNNTADATTSVKTHIKAGPGLAIAQSAAIIWNATTWSSNSPTEPRNLTVIAHTDPDGSVWTLASLTTTQIGYTLHAAGTNRARTTLVWALVDYTPGTEQSAAAAGGIASTEAFGTVSLSEAQGIGPGGIDSAEAFGTAALAHNLTASAVASAGAHGTAALTSGIAAAEGIDSGEAFETPALHLGLETTSITTTAEFGTTGLGLDISPAEIESGEAHGSATVTSDTAETQAPDISASQPAPAWKASPVQPAWTASRPDRAWSAGPI